jgi:3-phenylpropionate/trans-cinnamate dioxygenase ferredoxin subunit
LELEGVRLLVCNSGGEVVVVENRCSHQEQPLEGGRVRNGYIFCPIHGMRYKLANGEAVGQLTRVPIKVFETRVVDGDVQVRLTAD